MSASSHSWTYRKMHLFQQTAVLMEMVIALTGWLACVDRGDFNVNQWSHLLLPNMRENYWCLAERNFLWKHGWNEMGSWFIVFKHSEQLNSYNTSEKIGISKSLQILLSGSKDLNSLTRCKEVKGSISSTEKPYLCSELELSLGTHTYNPSYRTAEAGRLQVQSLSGLEWVQGQAGQWQGTITLD